MDKKSNDSMKVTSIMHENTQRHEIHAKDSCSFPSYFKNQTNCLNNFAFDNTIMFT